MNDIATVSGNLAQLAYALDTFYFLLMGAFVMWMAAGFAMLEAGLVRAKNTTEILTKNVLLYAIASVMYLLIGYNLMYINDSWAGIIPDVGFLIGDENTADAVTAGGDDAPYYSARSDFFFQVVFVATGMSIISGAVAERMKLMAFLAFAVIFTGFIYPYPGFVELGRWFPIRSWFQRLRRLRYRAHVRSGSGSSWRYRTRRAKRKIWREW